MKTNKSRLVKHLSIGIGLALSFGNTIAVKPSFANQCSQQPNGQTICSTQSQNQSVVPANGKYRVKSCIEDPKCLSNSNPAGNLGRDLKDSLRELPPPKKGLPGKLPQPEPRPSN